MPHSKDNRIMNADGQRLNPNSVVFLKNLPFGEILPLFFSFLPS